jgi:hypothetical protein
MNETLDDDFQNVVVLISYSITINSIIGKYLNYHPKLLKLLNYHPRVSKYLKYYPNENNIYNTTPK